MSSRDVGAFFNRRSISEAMSLIALNKAADIARLKDEPIYEVIQMIASDADVDLSRLNNKGRLKLLESANTALLTVAFGSSRIEHKDGLGESWLAPDTKYEVETRGHVRQFHVQHGLSLFEMKQTAKHPNAFQHCSPPPDLADDNLPLFSIFVRVLNTQDFANGVAAEWAMVLAERNFRSITIQDAYRVKQSWFDDAESATPLGLFKKFVDKFGLRLSIDGSPAEKFISYSRLKGRLSIVGAGSDDFTTCFRLKHSRENESEVAYAYAINLSQYASYLNSKD